MNFELFIAKKTFFQKENQSRFTQPIINIAVIGISLSIAVMLVSMAILAGFKKDITDKVIGFANHIQIINYDSNQSFETKPIPRNLKFLPAIDSIPEVKHIQSFALKAGIIKTNEEIQGVVLKGVSTDFNWENFNQFIVDGKAPNITDTARTNEVLISKRIAELMHLKTGDKFNMFFIENTSRMRFRKFTISGVYSTQLEEFDNIYIIADMAHVQRLYGWNKNQISGFEITLNDFKNVQPYSELIEDMVGYEFLENDSRLRVINIRDKYSQMFDWLKLMDLNELVILVLTLIVAGFNMISGLLILILERTNMIGILKAVGAQNWSVRKIFIYQSTFILIKGLLWGNIISLVINFGQKYLKIIKLDEANYFLSEVPILINPLNYIWINLGTIGLVFLILLIPSMVIAKISPERTIKYE